MKRRHSEIKRSFSHIRRRIKQMKTYTKVLLFAGIPLVILVLIIFSLHPNYLSERRYLLEQGKGATAILFNEGSILVVHLAIYLGATLGLWLFYHFHEKRAFQIYSILLVVLVLAWSTWNLAKASRLVAAKEAEKMCADTARHAHDQLGRSTRYTTDAVILDQAIARMISYIHLMVRSEYPEFQLRTVSLHMLPINQDDHKIWNVIQEGSQAKDAPFLQFPNSFVGSVIRDHEARYCPDVTSPSQFGDACKDFQRIENWRPAYKSLVCYPLTGGSPEVFAGLCFDSKLDRAFDKQEEALQTRLKDQIEDLTPLVNDYRKQEAFFFKPSPTPPEPAPK